MPAKIEIRVNKAGTPFVQFAKFDGEAFASFKETFRCGRRWHGDKKCWELNGTAAVDVHAWLENLKAERNAQERPFEAHFDMTRMGQIFPTDEGPVKVIRWAENGETYKGRKVTETFWARGLTADEKADYEIKQARMVAGRKAHSAADAELKALCKELEDEARTNGEEEGSWPIGRQLTSDGAFVLEADGALVAHTGHRCGHNYSALGTYCERTYHRVRGPQVADMVVRIDAAVEKHKLALAEMKEADRCSW